MRRLPLLNLLAAYSNRRPLSVARLWAATVIAGAICLTIPGLGLAGGSDGATNVVESFDVNANGDALLLPTMIDSRQYMFLVVTGSSVNVVDPTVTGSLPLLAKRKHVIGGAERQMYSTRDATVGKHTLPVGAEAVELDLAGFRKTTGYDIRGILGMPFLKTQIVEFDFDHGKLLFLKSVPGSAGREYPLILDRWERPMLSVAVPGDDSIPMLVDSGMIGVGASLQLRSGQFDLLLKQGLMEMDSSDLLTASAIGYRQVRRSWLKTLTLGEVTHQRLGVAEGSQSAIGLSFLLRYAATFDFQNQRLYLRPRVRVLEQDSLDLTGLHIWKSDTNGVEIAGVDPGSIAAAAEIKAGDRILKFDGKDVSSVSLFELRTLLATENRRITLKVANSSGDRNVKLELKRAISENEKERTKE